MVFKKEEENIEKFRLEISDVYCRFGKKLTTCLFSWCMVDSIIKTIFIIPIEITINKLQSIKTEENPWDIIICKKKTQYIFNKSIEEEIENKQKTIIRSRKKIKQKLRIKREEIRNKIIKNVIISITKIKHHGYG